MLCSRQVVIPLMALALGMWLLRSGAPTDSPSRVMDTTDCACARAGERARPTRGAEAAHVSWDLLIDFSRRSHASLTQ